MRKYELALRYFQWFKDIRDKLGFEHEIVDVSINYTERTCVISIKIDIPSSKHDELKHTELPKYNEYRIKDIKNSSFKSIKELFYLSENKYICNANIIPQFDDKILLILEGTMTSDFLNRLIRVQPAMNRDQTEEIDSYWLYAMIKDIEMWDKIWLSMEVEDVDLLVDVSLDRVFTIVLPPGIQRRIDATRRYLTAGRGRVGDDVIRSWQEMRRAIRQEPYSFDSILEISRKLLMPDNFINYLEIDDPYRIGRMEGTSLRAQSNFPEQIKVTAKTDLNYKEPIAEGYLTFKKKSFIDLLNEEIEKLD